MKDSKKDENDNGINQIAAAVTGVLVGAGAVVAGAVILNDKKNKAKVDKAVEDVKSKARELKKDTEEKMSQVGDKVQKLVEVAKEPLDTPSK